jgi:anti-sigma factor RsiW
VRWRVWRTEVVCQQWVELVTAYLDGALPRRLTHAIDRHLAGCEHCREYLAQMRVTIHLVGEVPDEPVPDDVLDALQAAFADYHGRASGPDD